MKIAVLSASGPFSTAATIRPIQLSPASIDLPLCWLVSAPIAAVEDLDGVSTEYAGSLPAAASVSTCAVGTTLSACFV